MSENTDADGLVMVESFPTSNSRNIFSQSILFDRYIVSYEESEYYFGIGEGLIAPPITLEEYMISLKNYLVNGTKILHFAGRVLAENLTELHTPVRYLVMDSLYLTDVYNSMIQDPFFNPIRNFSVVDYDAVNTRELIYRYYNLTIFEIIVN